MAVTAGKLLFLLVTAILASYAAVSHPFPPPSQPLLIPHTITYPPSLFATIFSTLGFQELSIAAVNANFSFPTPTTIFAPTDSSLLTCPACSLPLLIQEHSIPGLYNLHFLRNLAFGTKIETLAPNRCLTITASPTKPYEPIAKRKVFVNGVEITKPDLFNNGLFIIHGVHGFMSHLSPTSCAVEKMTTLAFPNQPPDTAEFLIMRFLLKEAMMLLRVNGFGLLALAMRVKYPELSQLKSMTIFALDDASIFAGGGGHAYVTDLMFHIVPGKLLKGSDLKNLPVGFEIPTMEHGQKLVVTTAGGAGFLAPMKINYVKIKSFDIVTNKRIVVHALSTPFSHVHRPAVNDDSCNQNHAGGVCENSSGTAQMTGREGE
ncbi:OLC1v1007282C1 [Oldenlandia corymbosa var. corymbosa]|uniref:OLC1v1007282C1 n=1 Tax=Oldenlandia corymbosa var. corymbosa TaxID=529605 RepID=A0AAV1DIX5_OLDCO|nr:OLC1v1007282C1 [Oldenlandia corymbosa var. corymbosa]